MVTVFLPLLGLLARPMPAAADNPGYFTNPSPPDAPKCPAGTYTVPSGTRYVLITAYGGAGAAGSTKVLFPGINPGVGGTGAAVEAIFPVTAGQTFSVVVGRKGDWNAEDVATTYSGWPDGGQNPYNNGGGGGSSFVTTQKLVASTGCKDIASSPLDRSQIVLLAGGGGGGGNGGSARSGGNGGNAGANADFSGQAGSDAPHDIACDYGRGGAGGTVTAAGAGGAAGCVSSKGGAAGNGFYGGENPLYNLAPFTLRAGASGAGGGGWYGGGGGSTAGTTFLGGGGGGAGSSYVRSDGRRASVSQAVDDPSVHIQPLSTPTTTIYTGEDGAPLASWYTSSPTIWFRSYGGWTGGKTYYAIDNPACSPTNLSACKEYRDYSDNFTVSNGVHTLTYFSIDGWGLEELVKSQTFAVIPGVTGGTTTTGTNPTASAGGAAGMAGSISVSGTGTGTVGAALYSTNPAGALTFNSGGGFVDVIASGSGLTGLTIKHCNLVGGNRVYWWDGAKWVLASHQTYDAATRCVTVTVNGATSPSLSQMTGTVFVGGTPPWVAAGPFIVDDNGIYSHYTPGTWTNRSVVVAFDCSRAAKFAGVDPSSGWVVYANGITEGGGYTLANDGQNQSASGTCTDGLGQMASATVADIDIDKSAPAVTRNVAADSCSEPGTNGWCRGTQTAGFSASDPLSGLADPAQATFTRTSSTEGAAITIASGTVSDNVGNQASGIAAGPFKIDRTPPVLAAIPNRTVDATGPGGAALTFTAAATDNLDPSPAISCSRASGSTFAIGTSTVNCTATDAAGNQGSASFSVTVRGAAEQIARLQLAVAGVGPGTSLADKAQAAATAIGAGNKASACSALHDFLNHVDAQRGKKLTEAQAQQFTTDAKRIRAVLGCP